MTDAEIRALSDSEIQALVVRAQPEPAEVLKARRQAARTIQRGLDLGVFKLGRRMEIIRNPDLKS